MRLREPAALRRAGGAPSVDPVAGPGAMTLSAGPAESPRARGAPGVPGPAGPGH